jgi:succinate-semialdehyde dehydrogenase/glutarate-semialdehyde dehydrogenase
MRQPVGPCLLITPWNFPLAMGTRKIGPAIAAGCTMVVKPAKQTPLSMLALVRFSRRPASRPGCSTSSRHRTPAQVTDPLFDDPRLRKLSFTGSTEVGRTLAKRAMDGMLRVSMELGGNAPLLVFDDADLELAVDQAMMAKLRNMGEACTSANRMYVAAPVASRSSRAGWRRGWSSCASAAASSPTPTSAR